MAQKSTRRPADAEQSKRNVLIAAGVATGIGSAALVAALLYSGRAKKDDKPSALQAAEPTD